MISEYRCVSLTNGLQFWLESCVKGNEVVESYCICSDDSAIKSSPFNDQEIFKWASYIQKCNGKSGGIGSRLSWFSINNDYFDETLMAYYQLLLSSGNESNHAGVSRNALLHCSVYSHLIAFFTIT